MTPKRIDWQDHIEASLDLHHGDPCIKGTRIPVKTIIGSLADGMSPGEIMAAYPQLTREDILAATTLRAPRPIRPCAQ